MLYAMKHAVAEAGVLRLCASSSSAQPSASGPWTWIQANPARVQPIPHERSYPHVNDFLSPRQRTNERLDARGTQRNFSRFQKCETCAFIRCRLVLHCFRNCKGFRDFKAITNASSRFSSPAQSGRAWFAVQGSVGAVHGIAHAACVGGLRLRGRSEDDAGDFDCESLFPRDPLSNACLRSFLLHLDARAGVYMSTSTYARESRSALYYTASIAAFSSIGSLRYSGQGAGRRRTGRSAFVDARSNARKTLPHCRVGGADSLRLDSPADVHVGLESATAGDRIRPSSDEGLLPDNKK
ncbi:hypothetical protein C8R45DRAFT_510010 [Mycena sanguinolenta]|nr:hypothetical protein C8R45DRAFT_510010 [Mycena sanguinolenta]